MFRNIFRSTEPDAVIARSMEELQLKTEANIAAWGLGSTDRWDVDFDTRKIKFSNADGYAVTADVQVIGSYNSDDGAWLWSWANPSTDAPLTQAALLARAFGEKYKLRQFTQRKIECSEADAWNFTAVGLHLFGSAGGYRGPASDSLFIFMTFGEVTIRRVH
jgi:hypothetical protein